MNRLKDKVALVTGAGRGIGEGIARAFAAEGATVWVTDLDEDAAEAVARSIGSRARALRLDVREEGDWTTAATALGEAGQGLQILVNNAGITGFEGEIRPHDPEHASLADWRAVHATNLDGTFLGCRMAIALMRQSGAGSIINISSRSGMVGIPGAAAYASSKAAIRNHSKTVALWCAGAGLAIRCNSVHPAAILTPMWDPVLGDAEGREQRMAAYVADTPLKRFGTVEEVAAVAVMLASDEAAYITGTEISIDGGLLAGSAASPG